MGFYTKVADSNTTKITYMTEDVNSFLRVSELTNSQRGVMYNTGIELQPGTYTFSVDVRVSEKETDAHYTEYAWATEAKDSMQMRTILQNPDNVGSGNYAAFDPVDKDTVMNPDGAVTSTQQKVTREWSTITDVIVLEKPTVVIFKIGGGMSGDPDSHGFDIDNLSIKGVYVIPEGGLHPDLMTEDVPGNLFVNGNFNTAPTIVACDKFDESAINSWFQNDGEGFEKDYYGVDIPDKPIYIPHKIEWTDGYLTFSGRTNNVRTFYYSSGVQLEPGNYTLTFKIKTAGEFQSTMMRVAVAGFYEPTANNDISVNTAPNYILREPDNNTTNTRQRITENNNYVNVVGQVITDELVYTSKAAPVKVFAEWTPVEFTFTTEEAITVSEIRIGGTHALLDTDLAVTAVTIDVKDIVINKAN